MERIRYTANDVLDADGLEDGLNCGMGTAPIDNSTTVGQLMGIRRAAGPGYRTHYDGYTAIRLKSKRNVYGAVFLTTTQREATVARRLPKAGFKKLFTYKNPSTPNTLTIWAAKPLVNGGRAVEDGLK